jgi:hypothetical protein
MSIINGLTDGRKEMHNVNGRWKLASSRCTANVVSECLSLDIIHDHVGDRDTGLGKLSGLKVVDLDDIRMMQRSDNACFTGKTRDEFGICLQIRVKYLNGHVAM